MDSWTIAKEVDPIGQNSKGDLIRAIHNGTGWIKLSGDKDLLYKLSPGTKVRHGPVKVYGKSSFATLYEIEKPQQGPQVHKPGNTWEPPDSYQREKELHQVKPPEPQILGGLPQTQGVPTWEEYKRVAYAAQDLAMQLESDIPCDPKTNDQYISNSMARAAIVQSILVAYRDGKVQAPKEAEPEIPGADAPMPGDDDIQWGRAS